MEFIKAYIQQGVFLPHLVEFIAMLTGIFYLNRIQKPAPGARIFVFYLILIWIIEIIGLYPAIAYYTDYQIFEYIKDTRFASNTWLFNIFEVIQKGFLFLFFRENLRSNKARNLLSFVIIGYLLIGATSLITFGNLFESYNLINFTLGTFILIFCIATYFMELLQSDKILDIKHDLIFYIAVALLLWSLCITPLFIYSSYINTQNEFFVDFYFWTLKVSVVFLYGTFVYAFYRNYKFTAQKQF